MNVYFAQEEFPSNPYTSERMRLNIGIFSTLEKAKEAISHRLRGSGWSFFVYEETLDAVFGDEKGVLVYREDVE